MKSKKDNFLGDVEPLHQHRHENISESSQNIPSYEPTIQKNDCMTNYAYTITLIVNVLERFAYYGLLCNYIIYLSNKPLYWNLFNSSTLAFIFMGINHISSVISGWYIRPYIVKSIENIINYLFF
jgi:hypothetical protein